MHGSRGGGARGLTPPRPPEKSQKYRVSLQYWSGSPKKPNQHSMLAHHLLVALLKSYMYLDPLINIKIKKNVVKVGTPLTKLSGSAHGSHICYL